MKPSKSISKETFIPLNICAKRKPPSIAIVYTLSTRQNKKYLHEIPLPTFSYTETADDLYKVLMKSESMYLSIVPKEQLIRVIEQITSKFNLPRSITKGESKENNEDGVISDTIERSPLKECELNESDRETQELPEGFQRVFVEDLNRELLMDDQGNLYDEEGNILGQAASEDEIGFDDVELA